jgi:hypothetical protein
LSLVNIFVEIANTIKIPSCRVEKHADSPAMATCIKLPTLSFTDDEGEGEGYSFTARFM